jgi:hypothetical protein
MFKKLAAALLVYLLVTSCHVVTRLTPPPPTLSAMEVDATQGARARWTQRALSTQEAEASATKMARQAQTATAAAKTAMAAATATAASQATSQAVIAAQTNWPMVLSDSFADNHLGWPVGVEKGLLSITTTIAEKSYVWETVAAEVVHGHNVFPLKTRPLTDFVASVKVTFIRGGDEWRSFGLAFRHSDQGYVFFGIDRSGEYWLRLDYPAGTPQVLDDFFGSRAAIHTQFGQVNQLTVHALGRDLVFVINGEVVRHLHQDFPAGDVGLGVECAGTGETITAEFSDFEVRAPK